MNIIVDYGLGNLGSVIRGFNRAGIDTKLSRDLEEIKNADSLILPGVGAFGDAMNKLNELELVDTIKDFATMSRNFFISRIYWNYYFFLTVFID